METTLIKMEVLKLNNIEPELVMRQPLRLKIQIEVNKHKVAKLILDSQEEFTIEIVKEILKGDGISLIEI